jgi:D-alanyl-D-alanine carboxypeptidase/D-alanyl-D-alanine-endopeptidase (penicillin-binding protein 4)
MKPQSRRTRRVAALATLTIGALLVAGPAQSAGSHGKPVGPAIRAIMEKPNYATAAWGLLEIDPVSGKVIHSSRAEEMFIPASTAKLFSVSAAWKAFGGDHRITTPVYGLGSRDGTTFDGNLVLVGAGDLTLGGRTKPDGTVDFTNNDHGDANDVPGATLTPEDPLAGIKDLARQVRAAGITAVHGDVVVDARLFHNKFDPDPVPLSINDNLIDILSTPTTPGEPATVMTRPESAAYTVDASVVTVPAGQPSKITFTGEAPGHITVTGTIAAGSAPILRVADIADPNSYGRTVFIEALQEAGVTVDASPVGDNPTELLPATMDYPASTLVAAYEGPPNRENAKLILKVSLNIGANLDVCLLAVQAGSSDCNDGFAPMKSFLQSAGVDTAQVALADGRGGDPVDRATPTAVIQMLDYWTDQPDFEEFRHTLPILGVDGSLAAVATDTPAKGHVFAKTGTAGGGDLLNELLVLQAKALAGYIATPGGGFRAFDLVVNNAGGSPDFQIVLDVNQDIGQIVALLWEEANRSK